MHTYILIQFNQVQYNYMYYMQHYMYVWLIRRWKKCGRLNEDCVGLNESIRIIKFNTWPVINNIRCITTDS